MVHILQLMHTLRLTACPELGVLLTGQPGADYLMAEATGVVDIVPIPPLTQLATG